MNKFISNLFLYGFISLSIFAMKAIADWPATFIIHNTDTTSPVGIAFYGVYDSGPGWNPCTTDSGNPIPILPGRTVTVNAKCNGRAGYPMSYAATTDGEHYIPGAYQTCGGSGGQIYKTVTADVTFDTYQGQRIMVFKNCKYY